MTQSWRAPSHLSPAEVSLLGQLVLVEFSTAANAAESPAPEPLLAALEQLRAKVAADPAHARSFELAAAYGRAVLDDAVIDDGSVRGGNTRAAWTAARVFLMREGYNLLATPEEAADVFRRLSSGEISTDLFAIWLSSHAIPRGG